MEDREYHQVESPHLNWCFDQGLEDWLAKDRPQFLIGCKGVEEETDKYCGDCPHKVECEEYFKPLMGALEAHWSKEEKG